MSTDRRVIALGNLAGELKSALEGAVQGAGLELFLTREPARAFVELERGGAIAVLVDMATLGAEQFCKRARSAERLRGVPVIGMSRTPNELGFARVFAWGADDLVPLGARAPLERRLKILATTERPDNGGFGQAVVAEATTQRRALVGRVLSQAGYDVKFAVDRAAVELYASQSETRLVVISAALGDPRRIIDAAARAGALPTWIVTAEMRSVNRLAASLAGLDRVAVTSTAGSPEDVLFLANELVFGKGTRRREWRALYATPVAFRAVGNVVDEYGFSYDAGPKGLYVRSLLPCEADDVEVELRLPARDERVRLLGKIMRRFAFGTGSIASAPPGFGIKLEGPEVSLALWAEACAELIAGASSEGSAPPPRQKGPMVSGSDPNQMAADVGLALPPATLTIESVVAPLPVDGPDSDTVGDLLAATLDEQTLTEVGTRPVTIDDEGVREERPSEYGLRAPTEPPGPSDAPAIVPAAGAPPEARDARPLPLPLPGGAGGAAKASDWDDMPTSILPLTAVAPTEPSAVSPAAAPPPPSAAAAAAGRPAPNVAASKAALPPPMGRKQTLIMGAPPPAAAPSPAALAGTMMMGAPAPRASREEIIEIEVDPSVVAPLPKDEPPPAPVRTPQAKAPAPIDTEAPDPSPREGKFRTPAEPFLPVRQRESQAAPPPAAFEPESLDATLPVPHLPPGPARAASADPAPEPRPAPWASTARIETARVETAGVEPTRVEPTRAETAPRAAADTDADIAAAGVPKTGSRGRAVLVVAILALAAGAAIVVGFGSKLGLSGTGSRPPTRPEASAAPAAAATTAEVAPSVGTPSAPPATDPAVPAAAAPSAVEAAPSAPPSASAAPPVEAPSAAPVGSTTAAPVTPTTPVPDFNLNTLPAERAALFVRSSATARVFVHGTDYGETNTVLVTSCGIRFVRLGRKLGDFIEPGRSYVVKCGRLTELSIEPVR